MGNIKLIFSGTEKSSTENKELEVFKNMLNEICIRIKDSECYHDYDNQNISLNKESAVRLVRELKKQIGYLESEVINE